MPGPAAVAIAVSAVQQSLLQRLAQRQTAPQRLVRRVRILLALADDPCIDDAAQHLRPHPRHRPPLARPLARRPPTPCRRAEQEQASEPACSALIEQALDDAPRPGGPATFSPEQIVGIVAVACEPPAKSGRPISHWTARELADEAKKRQIVKRHLPPHRGAVLKDRPTCSRTTAATGSTPTRLTLRSSAGSRRRCATCTSGPGSWPSRASTSSARTRRRGSRRWSVCTRTSRWGRGGCRRASSSTCGTGRCA